MHTRPKWETRLRRLGIPLPRKGMTLTATLPNLRPGREPITFQAEYIKCEQRGPCADRTGWPSGWYWVCTTVGSILRPEPYMPGTVFKMERVSP